MISRKWNRLIWYNMMTINTCIIHFKILFVIKAFDRVSKASIINPKKEFSFQASHLLLGKSTTYYERIESSNSSCLCTTLAWRLDEREPCCLLNVLAHSGICWYFIFFSAIHVHCFCFSLFYLCISVCLFIAFIFHFF